MSSGRYSKVLTLQNVQLFVGGSFLATTIGCIWLKPRMERTAALQEELDRIRWHLYWSMPLTQRSDVHIRNHEMQYYAHLREQRRIGSENNNIDHWWNGKLAWISAWAMKPGCVTNRAIHTRDLVKDGVASGCYEAKRLIALQTRKAGDQIKTAVRWNEALHGIQTMWIDEKTRWQEANAKAIAAVHPHYKNSHTQIDKS